MKKVIKNLVCLVGVLCLVGSALAATTTTFYVNGVKINGKLTYVYNNDINPFTKDSVTAKTTSVAAMDRIEARATIAYYEGSVRKTTSDSGYATNARSKSITVKASGIGNGSTGSGEHYASHNGLSHKGYTNVIFQ